MKNLILLLFLTFSIFSNSQKLMNQMWRESIRRNSNSMLLNNNSYSGIEKFNSYQKDLKELTKKKEKLSRIIKKLKNKVDNYNKKLKKSSNLEKNTSINEKLMKLKEDLDENTLVLTKIINSIEKNESYFETHAIKSNQISKMMANYKKNGATETEKGKKSL